MTDWELGAQACVWIVDGIEDARFHAWKKEAARALGAEASLSSHGSGAWEECEPWAHLVGSGSVDLRRRFTSVELDQPAIDFPLLGARWSRAVESLEAHCRSVLPAGSWFIHSAVHGRRWDVPSLGGALAPHVGEGLMALGGAMRMRAQTEPPPATAAVRRPSL